MLRSEVASAKTGDVVRGIGLPALAWYSARCFAVCERRFFYANFGELLSDQERAVAEVRTALMPWNEWVGQIVKDVVGRTLGSIVRDRTNRPKWGKEAHERILEYVHFTRTWHAAFESGAQLPSGQGLRPLDIYGNAHIAGPSDHEEVLEEAVTLLRRFQDSGVLSQLSSTNVAEWVTSERGIESDEAGYVLFGQDLAVINNRTATIYSWQTSPQTADREQRDLEKLNWGGWLAPMLGTGAGEPISFATLWLADGPEITERLADPVAAQTVGHQSNDLRRELVRRIEHAPDTTRLVEEFVPTSSASACLGCQFVNCPRNLAANSEAVVQMSYEGV